MFDELPGQLMLHHVSDAKVAVFPLQKLGSDAVSTDAIATGSLILLPTVTLLRIGRRLQSTCDHGVLISSKQIEKKKTLELGMHD